MSKISELSNATTLTGAETFPLVQSGSTVKDTISDVALYTIANAGLTGPGYISGRYYMNPFISQSLSTANVGANSMFFVPIYIYKTQTFTGMAYWATASTPNARFGVYTNNNGVPGTLVGGTEIGAAAIVTGSTQDRAFTAPVSFTPGWYWMAILTDGTVTLTSSTSSNNNHAIHGVGVLSMTGMNVRLTAAQTYGALPSSAPTASWTEASGMIVLALKAQ